MDILVGPQVDGLTKIGWVEPKVDSLGEKWMVISDEAVKLGWIEVAVHSVPL